MTMRMEVVTPERVVLKDSVSAAVLPGAQGYIGILKDHAPMVVALRAGVVKFKEGGHYRRMAVSGGFAEVSGNVITVLADTAERAEEIDVNRAQAAAERARLRLKEKSEHVDVARARVSLQRAMARLRAAGGQAR
jgi:F-type H+-transporting ATPase subunit epsilon